MKILLIDFKTQCEGPTKLFSDNKSTINIAHSLVQLDRTKQEIDSHFIKGELEKLDNSLITRVRVPSKHQLAGVLTKILPSGVSTILLASWGSVVNSMFLVIPAHLSCLD